ncbi:hypothetical protein C1896_14255 [Pseudomonadaceae bacterium SI-3]|nr:hypothetical protein C1896_14255 [Pseudomonadaceae bacterium SI-3]
MPRPAYLLSTALLAAVAIPLLETMPTDLMKTASNPSQVTTPRLSVPASTISSSAQSKPAQAQRWIF